MAHDAHGAALNVGDLVMIHARVSNINGAEAYLNVEIEVTSGPSKLKSSYSIHSGCLEKVTDLPPWGRSHSNVQP